MEILLSILLGILQGVTEFFPVSSSGHLAFFEKLFGHNLHLTTEEMHLFNVMVHFATAIAVIIVFQQHIWQLIKALFNKNEYKNVKEKNNIWLIILIFVSTVPTAVMGFLFRGLYINMGVNLLSIGIMFFITAILLFLIKLVKTEKRDEYKKVGIIHAIFIGIMQGLAIAPGISRSGSTIAACRYSGISREKSGEFAFLLAIPAILGAALLEVTKAGAGTAGIYIYILGFVSSFITGYIALRFLLVFIKKGKLHYFGFYVIIMGIISIVLHWRGT